MYDASIPSIRSSTTILFPASPNDFFTKILSTADNASSVVSHTMTPLPAARPSAFMTSGNDTDSIYSFAKSDSSKILNLAVGISFLSIKFFAQILLDSNFAAFCVGPNIFKFFSMNVSTIPNASGTSGPTTVKQSFLDAKSTNSSICSTFIGILFFVPPFPGA